MTNPTNKIYDSIHKVLSHLAVEKGGTLPGNLGGSAYHKAEDISNEVKNQLVANKVIVEANEEVVKVESPDYGDKKMRFVITLKGTYRLIHIEDGSFITISGVGQGMGTGVSTAAAVASTFSLKSALLRTFLISESGVESEGVTEQAAPKQDRAQQTVAAAVAPPKKSPVKPPADKDNKEALARISADTGPGKKYNPADVSALNEKIAAELGKSKGEVMVELEKRLLAGEVA